jgi:multidrug efflux pump
MTSLATVLGTLPIALALGASSGNRVSMGIAIVGGLILSTTLTLFVIPAIYSYFSSKKRTDDKDFEKLESKIKDEEINAVEFQEGQS